MSKIDWEEGLLLEQEVAALCQEQAETGVYFKRFKAFDLISDLTKRRNSLEQALAPELGYTVTCLESTCLEDREYKTDFGDYLLKKGEKSFVKKLKLNSGENTSVVLSWSNGYNTLPDGPFSRISISRTSLSKRKQVITSLLRRGWKPASFSAKSRQPKLTEAGLPVSSISKVGKFGKDLADWYTYSHRLSQIKGFLVHVRRDSRISAGIDSCGTNTFRGKHRVVANIPRPTSMYGSEMRSLFGVKDSSRRFVGADVSGLELRMLCHHMKDPDYTKILLEGDIHTYNMEMAGLSNRDQAKKFIYTWLYGGGNSKIGEAVGGTARNGAKLKKDFLESLPKLGRLLSRVQSFASRNGYLPSIDRRKIWIRKHEGKPLLHTALNALLQANGSIVTKRAMIISSKEVKNRGLDAKQVLFYHDEWANDCLREDAEEVGQIMVESIKKAGLHYNLDLPITGEFGVGKDWSIH